MSGLTASEKGSQGAGLQTLGGRLPCGRLMRWTRYHIAGAGLVLAGLLAGCAGPEHTSADGQLRVAGTVILPDSTALFGAEIHTEPATAYVSTDEQGRFWITLPNPGTYTFVAAHPDPRYRDLEGRLTEVAVGYGQSPAVLIMMGRTQRMPLMDVNERAAPAMRHGKKRTGR